MQPATASAALLSGTCSAGALGPARSIDTLTQQQLAQRMLNSSQLSAWDFGSRVAALIAPAGATVALACVVVSNATVSSPSGAGAFLQPTAIDLAGAAGLEMRSVSLSTDCATVLSYQQYLCSTYRVAGSLQLERGSVHFTTWQDGFTSLHDVTLTCPAPEAAAAPPCRLVAVQTAQQLLEAFTVYAAASADNLTVVVAANISIPTIGFWPSSPVLVQTHTTMLGSALLNRPVVDLGLNVKMWELQPPWEFHLINLTATNLAPSYYSPGIIFSQFGMLSERLWSFHRYVRLLRATNCTLVVPPEQLAYTTYWLTFLVSPVPEAQARASWIRIFGMKVAAVNGSGVFYESAVAWTVYYTNVRVTDTLEGGLPLLRQDTGLGQLLAESVPLTSANPANSTVDLRLALFPNNSAPDASGRRWVLLNANLSIADHDTWPAGSSGGPSANASDAALLLPNSTVLTRGPGLLPYRLSLAGRIGGLLVPGGSTLTLRYLIVSGLSGRLSSYDPRDPMGVLSGPLWGLGLVSASSKLRLENCSVLLSADELRLMQHALLPAGAAAALPGGRSYDSGLVEAVRRFYAPADALQVAAYGESHLAVDSGATQRYAMVGVTFRTPVAADGEVAAANFTALRIPYASGGGGTEGWVIGVIVGCVVGGVLLLAVAGLLVLRHRSRRAAGRRDTSAKALAVEAEAPKDKSSAGGQCSGLSPFMTQTHELTNSSQVLRLGGRASMDERGAAVSLPPKLPSDNTGSGLVGGSELTIVLAGGADAPGVKPSGSGTLPCSGSGGGSGSGGAHIAYAAVTAAGAAAAAAAHGGQAGGADSFDLPPTCSMLGQHGAAGSRGAAGMASSRSAGSVQGVGSNPGSGLGPQASPSEPAAGLGSSGAKAVEEAGGGRSRASQSQAGAGNLPPPPYGGGGGSAGSSAGLDQLHAMIQILGRDFNDRQLELQHMLGKGAYGTVYKGKWRGLPVAVKSMILCSESSVRQQHRPLMEAAISSNLAHPNIVTTYSYELREVEHELAALSPELARQGGGWRLLIIQEYCDAGPLRRIVDCGFFLTPKLKDLRRESGGSGGGGHCVTQGPAASYPGLPAQPPRQALDEVPADVPPRPGNRLEAALRYVEAALMIARGLQHIHDKNIVHGDLNPNNVLLMRAPGSPLGFCLKVADFGLSVRITEGESHLSNLFQGSPYYCAPEVVMSGKIGKNADIYSLGIMLWELQNGTRPPWRMGVRLRTFPSLNTAELEFGPETPPRYARLARECFHASKDARPGIAAVVEALSAIQQELGAQLPA